MPSEENKVRGSVPYTIHTLTFPCRRESSVSSSLVAYVLAVIHTKRHWLASQTALHYGWIPFIIYVGYTRSNPQPSLIKSVPNTKSWHVSDRPLQIDQPTGLNNPHTPTVVYITHTYRTLILRQLKIRLVQPEVFVGENHPFFLPAKIQTVVVALLVVPWFLSIVTAICAGFIWTCLNMWTRKGQIWADIRKTLRSYGHNI